MSSSKWKLRRLGTVSEAEIDGLAKVLIDCVEGGASVSFMHPLTHERAAAFGGESRRALRRENARC